MALRSLQGHPRALEIAYAATYRGLIPFRRWLKPGTLAERIFIEAERVSKGAIFGCQMCGQCVLHSTGMTCPMNCPKNLRNGPCGGVRPNGHCEVVPSMRCVWVQAWERSQQLSTNREAILHVLPPLDRRLHGTSAWINELNDISTQPPSGWST